MRKILLLTGLFLLLGCGHAPMERKQTENGWTVERCFTTKDGHTVYRFSNGVTDWRYYVVPSGTVIDEKVVVNEDSKHTEDYSIQTVQPR